MNRVDNWGHVTRVDTIGMIGTIDSEPESESIGASDCHRDQIPDIQIPDIWTRVSRRSDGELERVLNRDPTTFSNRS